MITNGQFIRQCLIEAGDRGCVMADIHKQRKAKSKELGLIYKGGTYYSFSKLLFFLKKLGWIEPTGEAELSHTKGNEHSLVASRTYYRITPEGLSHPEKDWANPKLLLYPRHK
jgi:hypothetical protein